jgi:hypothetical protein
VLLPISHLLYPEPVEVRCAVRHSTVARSRGLTGGRRVASPGSGSTWKREAAKATCAEPSRQALVWPTSAGPARRVGPHPPSFFRTTLARLARQVTFHFSKASAAMDTSNHSMVPINRKRRPRPAAAAAACGILATSGLP